MNGVMKWFFWLCGSTAVLVGMSAVLAGTVDQDIGVTVQGLGIMFASAVPFSTADYFKVRHLKASLATNEGTSRSRS